jgi:hypothetical protein
MALVQMEVLEGRWADEKRLLLEPIRERSLQR